jgi:ERCC4-related helicase
MLNESKGKKTPMKSTCVTDFGLISFVHGTHKDREQIFQGFKDGHIRILIATEGLIGEGFDYKGINVVVVGDGGKSSIQAIQKIGRGMRVLPGKTEVLIYDFADRCKYLSDHSMQRSTIWMNLGYEVDLTDVPYLEMRV